MTSINEQFLARDKVPDPHGGVEAPGRERLAVRTEGQALHGCGMTLEYRGEVSWEATSQTPIVGVEPTPAARNRPSGLNAPTRPPSDESRVRISTPLDGFRSTIDRFSSSVASTTESGLIATQFRPLLVLLSSLKREVFRSICQA